MKLHFVSGAQVWVCTLTPATGSHISQAGIQNDLSASTSWVLALQAWAKHAWFKWCRSSNPRLYVQRKHLTSCAPSLAMSSAFWKASKQKALWGYFAQVLGRTEAFGSFPTPSGQMCRRMHECQNLSNLSGPIISDNQNSHSNLLLYKPILRSTGRQRTRAFGKEAPTVRKKV